MRTQIEEENAREGFFMFKRLWALTLTCLLVCSAAVSHAQPLEAQPPFELDTPSYLLMEASTGQTILEKDADLRRPVASVTKLMTILLVLEALDEGAIALSDSVICSPEAAGMGGSQALLDAGSAYTVKELLKTVIVASANDSAVALSELLSGSETAFAQKMNQRAQQLGMSDTRYVNCTGLPAQGQYTTARDVALLSRQVGQFPLYFTFSTIWMDTLTHPGGRTTDLTNTNRLIRFYQGCDGFKTGSTDEARYCLSATASRDGTRMIAVVLGSPASQTRFNEARKLLEYGLSSYQLSQVCKEGESLGLEVAVRRGIKDAVSVSAGADFQALFRKGEESSLRMEAALPESVDAPILKGDILGEIRVFKGSQLLETLPAAAGEDVPLPGFLQGLLRILEAW